MSLPTRLSTIRDADLILMMEAGQIVEQGTHASLLEAGGVYAAPYAAQFAAPVAEVLMESVEELAGLLGP